MAGATLFDPGGCGCPSCSITFHATGCNSMDLPGATVDIWTDATKTVLLDSQATDPAGLAVLTIPGAGTYYREVSYPTRMATSSATSLMACGATIGVALLPATDYHCLAGCVLPLYKTIFATFSAVLPGFTLNWTALTGSWKGGLNYAYPGCGGCPAATVPMILDFANLQVSTNTLFPGCPGPNVTLATLPLATTSSVCPPSFSITATLPTNAFTANLFCGGSPGVTFTE